MGRFIEENAATPDTVHNVKILDMACGSGSFLIRAYDELLKWHSEGSGRIEADLDPQERSEILRSNIYGVDLDSQAVEVARLNLMLRALARRENLPSLADNLKTGNSLISGDGEELKAYFGEDWEEKRPFDWGREFEPTMKEGGFDIIIGNPPYVRIQGRDTAESDYYRNKYDSPFGSFDLYVVFLEKAILLLKPGGRLGFITSGKFLKNAYGKKIQQLLRSNTTIEQIVDLSAIQVFSDATTYPVIIVFKKGVEEEELEYSAVAQEAALGNQPPDLGAATVIPARQDAVLEGIWPPPTPRIRRIVDKLAGVSDTLGDISNRIFQGLVTGDNDVYYMKEWSSSEINRDTIKAFSDAIRRNIELEAELLKPLLRGRHIRRYHNDEADNMLIFPYRIIRSNIELISTSELAEDYPLCWEYLLGNKARLEGRDSGGMRHERWYAYSRNQNIGVQGFRKLTIPAQVSRLTANYDSEGIFHLDNVRAHGILLNDNTDDNYLYVLALLNSKLLNWRFHQISSDFRGGYKQANRQFIEPLPIRRVESSSAADMQIHRAIVDKARRMLELQERVGPVRDMFTNERNDLLHEVERVDSEIDALVYELYGLTSTERGFVEGEGTG